MQTDINAVAVDPRDPHRVYAAGSGGLARSDDAGRTWQPSSSGLDGAQIADLALNPAAPDTIYAATTDGDLFMSDDAGATWHPIAE